MLNYYIVRRRNFSHGFEGGTRRWDILQGKELIDGNIVRLPAHLWPSQQFLNFRSKKDKVAYSSVIKRLLAEAITPEDEFPVHTIPDRDCEHAAKPGENLLPPGCIAVNDDFSIGVAAKCVPFSLELATQLEKIIDLAIVADPNATVDAPHRLMPSR